MKTRRRLLRKQQHRKLASALFNRTWDLMEKKRRSAEEDAEMIRSAHASRYHWDQIGRAKNFAVGEWQLARVYSILQMPESAVYHAKMSLAYARARGERFDDFQLPSSYEGLARAYATAGDWRKAGSYLRIAKRLAERIKDPEDRKTILEQIASVPIKRK